ncbi:MAG TPA: hypothetical protein VN878_07435 [Usitatibacter sp.]|nr:hypothetical protein [Usitatibacter sp.]
MPKKTAVTPGDLYVMLDREFRRRQSQDCPTCYIQLPYRVDRHDALSSNWEVILPPPCRFGCRALLEQLVAEFSLLYDLASQRDAP